MRYFIAACIICLGMSQAAQAQFYRQFSRPASTWATPACEVGQPLQPVQQAVQNVINNVTQPVQQAVNTVAQPIVNTVTYYTPTPTYTLAYYQQVWYVDAYGRQFIYYQPVYYLNR